MNKVGAFSFFTIQFIIEGKRKIPLFYDMKFELQVFMLSQATPPVPFPNSCCLRVDRKDRRTVCADIRNFPRDSDASLPLFAVRHLPRKMFQPPHPGLYGDIGGRICGGGRVRKSAARELVNANRGWEISIYWLGCNQCSTRSFGWILTVVYVWDCYEWNENRLWFFEKCTTWILFRDVNLLWECMDHIL